MKEEKRLEIVNEITKDLYERANIKEKYEALKKLLENENVKKYIKLQDQINDIEVRIADTKLHQLTIDDKSKTIKDIVIEDHFNNSDVLDEESCSHDLWIYIGSYKQTKDYNEAFCSKTEQGAINSESAYKCLECGKIHKTSDYKTFEKDNIVIKSKENEAEKIKNFYYRTLYENTSEESIELTFSKFNKK